ncbi:MAG: hypothetical protein V1870_02975 [Candidatus Aenigmatarchaeota archaeon]
MFDEKRINEIKQRIPQFVKEKIITLDKDNKRFVEFYIMDGELSIRTAESLFILSNDIKLKNTFILPEDFDSYLWVINTSYYSMFYFAGALLAKNGIKINTEIGIHSKTFDALVFYLSEKLERKFIKEFEAAQKESKNLLGIDDNAKKKTIELLARYASEKEKRSTFTYKMGNIAKKNKAETSLKRAKEFIEHVKGLL